MCVCLQQLKRQMSPQLWLQTFYESPLKVSQIWDTSLETSESEHNNNYETILMFFLFLLQANLTLPVQQRNPRADIKPNDSPINTFLSDWISLNAHNSTWLGNVLRLTVRAWAPHTVSYQSSFCLLPGAPLGEDLGKDVVGVTQESKCSNGNTRLLPFPSNQTLID